MSDQKDASAGRKIVAQNRRARHDYTVLDTVEAGIQLVGTEVKVAREGKMGLAGAYAAIDKNTSEAFLYNCNIQQYDHGNRFNHDPLRPRRLLLHGKEILKLRVKVEQKGNTLIPLSAYFKRGRLKIELGVCKGKAAVDKRETIRRREADRDAARAMRRR